MTFFNLSIKQDLLIDNPAKLQLTQESSLQLLKLPKSRRAQCSGEAVNIPVHDERAGSAVRGGGGGGDGGGGRKKIDCKR